jgi:hypothetical protein
MKPSEFQVTTMTESLIIEWIAVGCLGERGLILKQRTATVAGSIVHDDGLQTQPEAFARMLARQLRKGSSRVPIHRSMVKTRNNSVL